MLTTKTTFKEIMEIKELKFVIPYMIWDNKNNVSGRIKDKMSFEDVQSENPTWNASDMVLGLQRLLDIGKMEENFIYNVYSEDEIEESPAKKHVKLFHFPAAGKRFVILAAGGGYGAVCSLPEAFPVAAKLNELGITAFCLNYRIGPPNLFPKPMEDLAAAYQFISKNAESFGINANEYAVCGFSAGGHLTASWGTKELGFRKYNLPAPEILLLNYPLLAFWRTIRKLPLPLQKMMLRGYLGKGYSKKMCQPYNIDENIDEEFPPVYLIQAENDDTVPIWNSEEMVEKLKNQQIPYLYEHPEEGGHGYGLGSNTDAEGWVERAVEFWGSLKNY